MNITFEYYKVLQNAILKTVANPKAKKFEVAREYATGIRSGEPIDWKVVNAAIVERWSRSGLNHIKTMAWKL